MPFLALKEKYAVIKSGNTFENAIEKNKSATSESNMEPEVVMLDVIDNEKN